MALVWDRAELLQPAAVGGIAERPQRSMWRKLFGRPAPELEASPWGVVVKANKIAPGIHWFTTGARGGYRLTPWRQRAVPKMFRTEDGWYEDFVEWAGVAVVFHLVFDRVRVGGGSDGETLYQIGKTTLRDWRPEEYESWFQTTHDEAEIESLAVTQFHRQHAERWIVLDAYDDREPFVAPGCLQVRAKWGGDPPYGARQAAPGRPSRWFVVDAAEFAHGRGKPFLIDPERHHEIDAPVFPAGFEQ